MTKRESEEGEVAPYVVAGKMLLANFMCMPKSLKAFKVKFSIKNAKRCPHSKTPLWPVY